MQNFIANKMVFSHFNYGKILACAWLRLVLAIEGLREKYFTAKGVRGPKSLGTTALDYGQSLLSRLKSWSKS